MDDPDVGASNALDPRIRRAMRILESEAPTPETRELAARVGLSLHYFVRRFTAQVGASPQAYARDIVMRHAAGRLRYTADPIGEIARDFGFPRLSGFSRAFTTTYGLSASRWRVRAQAELAAAEGDGGVRVVRLERFPVHTVLARRCLGPRTLASEQWADTLSRLPPALHRCARMGLLYDDPRETPPEAIRYDCAVHVRSDFALTEDLEVAGFSLLQTPQGVWACADVVGRSGVAGGYARVLRWTAQRSQWTLEGDPHLERFQVTPEDPDRDPVLTVCLRLRTPNEPPRPGLSAD